MQRVLKASGRRFELWCTSPVSKATHAITCAGEVFSQVCLQPQVSRAEGQYCNETSQKWKEVTWSEFHRVSKYMSREEAKCVSLDLTGP